MLRLIKEKVDFKFVRDRVRHLYSDKGRPSIDPIRLVKMWLIGYLYGIPSERRLEQEIKLNLAYRWFLDLQVDDRIPDHSTLSRNRNERFAGTDLFLAFFEEIVEQCKAAGLVQGEAVVTDSTHIRANASHGSKETVVVAKTPRDYWAYLDSAEIWFIQSSASKDSKADWLNGCSSPTLSSALSHGRQAVQVVSPNGPGHPAPHPAMAT
jgi:transposase